MDNLETLSNDALRLRLQEFGFANMPVTTTTRNVLIKKLRKAIDSSKSKTRRETVSVAKYSSADDSESENENKKPAKKNENRRATIAAPAAPKETRPIVKNVSRRSGRVTPLAGTKPILSLPDHSDDDLAIPEVIEAPRRSTKSRSPSLSNSAVVTTSYKQVIQPVVEEDDDLVIIEEESENGESSHREYDIPLEINPPPTYNGKSIYTKPTSIGGLDIGAAYADSLRRMTVGGGASVDIASSTLRSDSPKVSSVFAKYEAASSAGLGLGPSAGTSYKRRYTTNNAASNMTYSRHTDGYAEDEDLLNDAPFLSNFTRRLAELKAEPLGPAKKSVSRGSPVASPTISSYRTGTDYYRTYSDRPESRPAVRAQKKDTVSGTFVAFLRAFEGKIRWPLLTVLVVLLAIFVYVVFFIN